MSLVIGKRYQIELEESAIIGIGGMGKVYCGHDIVTGETVAVKSLNPDIIKSQPDIVERFAREAEALRRLNHDNIVHVHTTIDEGDSHYIVMDYMSGGSLQDLLDRTGFLPIKQAVQIALDVAKGLCAAHSRGIIHRDIKPANVLLAEDGTARLTDFGVAFLNDRTRVTRTGVVVGTVSYLSPEALNGEQLDERTDIWAFGIMLYEMIGGRHPFDDSTMTTLLTSVISQPPIDIHILRPETPKPLSDLLSWLLEKNRAQRIGSASDIVAALEKINLVIDTDELPVNRQVLQTVVEKGDLGPIRDFIKNGDNNAAKTLLRPLLKNKPSAEAWYLAAQVATTDEQKIKCLKQALELDPWHTPANRLLHKLEGLKPNTPPPAAQTVVLTDGIKPLQPLTKKNPRPLAHERRAISQRIWRRLGIYSAIILTMSCSLITLGLVGVVPGVINMMNTFLGGPAPIYEINGTPIEQLPDAPLMMAPSVSQQAPSQAMAVIDHGLMNEYIFFARQGESYSIWVQFLSINANRVSRNVVLLDPNGQKATHICLNSGNLLAGDNGVAFEECRINITGDWKLRVLGRREESVGAYFVGVQKLD